MGAFQYPAYLVRGHKKWYRRFICICVLVVLSSRSGLGGQHPSVATAAVRCVGWAQPGVWVSGAAVGRPRGDWCGSVPCRIASRVLVPDASGGKNKPVLSPELLEGFSVLSLQGHREARAFLRVSVEVDLHPAHGDRDAPPEDAVGGVVGNTPLEDLVAVGGCQEVVHELGGLREVVDHKASAVQDGLAGTKVLHRRDGELGDPRSQPVQNGRFDPNGLVEIDVVFVPEIGQPAGDDQVDEGKEGSELNIEARGVFLHGVQDGFHAAKLHQHVLLEGDEGHVDQGPAGHGLEFFAVRKPDHGIYQNRDPGFPALGFRLVRDTGREIVHVPVGGQIFLLAGRPIERREATTPRCQG
mmetsp:Transcript_8344/g.17365  ORF Transcript_8344/g.17365 Transcript_8344/m.17365 type:complete len:355 (-) Transcript_8344:1691-2755(-)